MHSSMRRLAAAAKSHSRSFSTAISKLVERHQAPSKGEKVRAYHIGGLEVLFDVVEDLSRKLQVLDIAGSQEYGSQP